MTTTIKNRISTVHLTNDDIVRIKYQPGVTSGIEDVKETYNSYLALADGRRLKKLTIIAENTYFEPSVNCHVGSDINPIAEAFVSQSLAIRLTLQNCSRLIHCDHPWRLFKTEEKAIEWLKSVV